MTSPSEPEPESVESLSLHLNHFLKESAMSREFSPLDLPMLTKVVGGRFRKEYGNQGAEPLIQALTQESVLELRREPDNAYHDNAIQVIQLDNEDYTEAFLGYIPREVADVLAPHMDQGAKLRVQSLGLGDGSVQIEAGEEEPVQAE